MEVLYEMYEAFVLDLISYKNGKVSKVDLATVYFSTRRDVK